MKGGDLTSEKTYKAICQSMKNCILLRWYKKQTKPQTKPIFMKASFLFSKQDLMAKTACFKQMFLNQSHKSVLLEKMPELFLINSYQSEAWRILITFCWNIFTFLALTMFKQDHRVEGRKAMKWKRKKRDHSMCLSNLKL